MLQLGDLAPDFHADTTEGPLRFHAWQAGHWAVLFSHPRDFTPVCTTELGSVVALLPEFHRRNVKVLGLSVDPLDQHRRWAQDIHDLTRQAITFPLIADPGRRIATLYGMVHPGTADTATVRTVFVIAPDHRVRLTIAYPMTTGRNFRELLRVIDALQLTSAYPVSTPADWQYGDDVIIAPSLSDAEAHRQFPRGWVASKPYLRFTPQPDHTP
jgi:alkyl hydroperoxide reductase subunit AhpC